MADERQLRCLIAAGGTVGHVAPALAVAEALQRRGALVTFAGSPDRVEATLVPERGYAFDAFSISGLPAAAGLALVRALGQALAAPAACLRILRERRPDVVLGAGGYVAGPMVLAARLRGSRARSPRPTRTSGSRTGSPRRSPTASSSRCPSAATGDEVPRRRQADPGARRGPPARRGARRARARPGRARRARLRRLARRARCSTTLALDALGRGGPAVIHLCGERDYPELRDRVTRPDYLLRPFIEEIGLRVRRRRPRRSRARAARSGSSPPPGCPPFSSRRVRHRRPPGEERALVRATPAARSSSPEAEAAPAPRVVEELLADPAGSRRWRAAMRAAAKPDAAEEIADELVGLASPVGASGSPASAAPA